MSLNGLTLRAKKSLSGLFSFSTVDGPPHVSVEPVQQAHRNMENEAPDLEEFGSHPHRGELTCPDLKAPSPSKSFSSRRQRLIGSLRSFSSLRSIRTSPSRSKARDESPPASPEGPRSPTRYMRNSLALNFKESPPGQPMFDLSKPRRSISSSVIVHHSSPVTVPSSSRQGPPFSVSVGPSVLPAGTVPTTPGPFQEALERDTASMTPSPMFSPDLGLDGMTEPIPTPMPGTNLTFEDMDPDIVLGPSSANSPEEHAEYFDVPVDDKREKLVEFDDSQYDCEAARRASAEALKDLIHNLEPATCETSDAEKLRTLRKKPTFSCQRADSTGLELLFGGCADNGSVEETPMEGMEHIVWEDDITLTVTASADTSYTLTAEEVATGRSTEDNELESDDRLQAWHTHTGLYDGSGYGRETESTISRPSTSTYETTETAPTSEDTTSIAEGKRKDSLVSATVSDRKCTPSQTCSDHHETLEEVIRAYAVYEEEEATCSSASDIAEDLELANKIGA